MVNRRLCRFREAPLFRKTDRLQHVRRHAHSAISGAERSDDPSRRGNAGRPLQRIWRRGGEKAVVEVLVIVQLDSTARESVIVVD